MKEDSNSDKPIPEDIVDKSISLTLRSRNITDENTSEELLKKRDNMLKRYDYTARVREEDDTLVLYPSNWLNKEGGKINLREIEDTGNAVEVSLSGPNKDANWEDIEKANSRIVSKVRDEYTDAYAANIRAFADFMGNYYLKKVTEATQEEKTEFKEEYYPRNVWPTEEQLSSLEDSIDILESIG